MTRFLKISFFFTLAVFFTFPVFSGWMINACAQTIDEYSIGSDDHDYGDVIGDRNLSDISSAAVNMTGTTRPDIYSNFIGRGDDKLFSSYTGSGQGSGAKPLETGEISLRGVKLARLMRSKAKRFCPYRNRLPCFSLVLV